MDSLIEHSLPFIARWGAWTLAGLLVLALAGIVRLGRGGSLLVPRRWSARVGSAGLVVLGACLAFGLYTVLGPLAPVLAQVRSVEVLVGRPVQELSYMKVEDETPARLGDLRGKVVLVNLWATWCPSCRTELPEIDRLQRTYADRGLVVVTLSNEEREPLLRFAAEHPLTTLNVRTADLAWLDVDGRPLSLVIDRRGVVRECVIGGRTYDEFDAMVQRYL
jgi:thiol-disulfide isomerase/thioredoxin